MTLFSSLVHLILSLSISYPYFIKFHDDVLQPSALKPEFQHFIPLFNKAHYFRNTPAPGISKCPEGSYNYPKNSLKEGFLEGSYNYTKNPLKDTKILQDIRL
jgi:hypothetical protein